MSAQLVGLMGKKRAGKDTFASTLIAERSFTRFAFADPMKDRLLALDPIVLPLDGTVTISCETASTLGMPRLSELVADYGWERAKESAEVRRLLQHYGTGVRELQPDFWLRATIDPATRHIANGGSVVITDVRFPNEADAIVRLGGTLVRIERPGLFSEDEHVSETALDDYPEDVRVTNVSLSQLASAARHLF